jgi:hypothetical protein
VNPYHQSSLPIALNGLTIYEKDYILAFHNLSRPIGWKAVNYPIAKDLSHMLSYQQIANLGNF